MLSRVADSIFWMARYMERTNGMLRLCRYSYLSSQDEVRDFSWKYVLDFYGEVQDDNHLNPYDSIQIIQHLVLEKDNATSIINYITKARENARGIQDHITKEVWQCLNEYYHLVKSDQIQSQIKQGDILSALDTLISQGWLYYGVADTTMSRGLGFAFLSLGKFIERTILTTNNLSIKLAELNYNLDDPIEIPALRYLLYALSGHELYLKTHKDNLKSDLVIQQIMLNPYYPHSILYCLTRITRYLARLQPETAPENFERLDFLSGKALNQIKYATIDMNRGQELKNNLQQTILGLNDLTGLLNEVYFGHI